MTAKMSSASHVQLYKSFFGTLNRVLEVSGERGCCIRVGSANLSLSDLQSALCDDIADAARRESEKGTSCQDAW